MGVCRTCRKAEITESPIAELPRLYANLTKLRLSLMVVVTTAVGVHHGQLRRVDWLLLLWTIMGTMACALSANALNQVLETRRDKLMARTQSRPTPVVA